MTRCFSPVTKQSWLAPGSLKTNHITSPRFESRIRITKVQSQGTLLKLSNLSFIGCIFNLFWQHLRERERASEVPVSIQHNTCSMRNQNNKVHKDPRYPGNVTVHTVLVWSVDIKADSPPRDDRPPTLPMGRKADSQRASPVAPAIGASLGSAKSRDAIGRLGLRATNKPAGRINGAWI